VADQVTGQKKDFQISMTLYAGWSQNRMFGQALAQAQPAYIFAFTCQYFESYPSSRIWRNTLEELKSPKTVNSHCFLAANLAIIVFVHSLRVVYVSVQALSRTIQCFIR
jgi:hypothetical protein